MGSCIPHTVTFHSSIPLALKILADFAGYSNIVYWQISWWSSYILKITFFSFCVCENKQCHHPKVQQEVKRQNNFDQSYEDQCWYVCFFPPSSSAQFHLYFVLRIWTQLLRAGKIIQYLKILKLANVGYKHHFFLSIRNICLFQEGYQETCPGRNTNWENVCSSIQNYHNRTNNKIFTMTQ